MTTRAFSLTTLSAVLVLTGACRSADSQTATDDPTPETPPAAATTKPGPLTTIPPDVRLPHEGSWKAGDPIYTDALPQMCLDPGPDLYPPDTTDQRDVQGDTGDGISRRESLGLFRDRRSARRAVEVWRQQTAECGHGLDHVGSPQDWIVREVVISGADEAWQSHDIGEPAPGQEDIAPFVPLTTVARVGNAVYVETARHEGRFDEDSIVALVDAEIASVAAYVPTLAVFGS